MPTYFKAGGTQLNPMQHFYFFFDSAATLFYSTSFYFLATFFRVEFSFKLCSALPAEMFKSTYLDTRDSHFGRWDVNRSNMHHSRGDVFGEKIPSATATRVPASQMGLLLSQHRKRHRLFIEVLDLFLERGHWYFEDTLTTVNLVKMLPKSCFNNFKKEKQK